jgi:hypothetical protein
VLLRAIVGVASVVAVATVAISGFAAGPSPDGTSAFTRAYRRLTFNMTRDGLAAAPPGDTSVETKAVMVAPAAAPSPAPPPLTFTPTEKLPWGGIAVRSTFASPQDLISAAPEIINVCHPEWHGVRAATYAQGETVVEVPGVIDDAHGQRLLAFFALLPRLTTIVVNGVPPRTIDLAGLVRQALPHVKVRGCKARVTPRLRPCRVAADGGTTGRYSK